LETARLEAERAEAERAQAARREAEKAAAERLEAERTEAAQREAQRIEAERIEAERKEAERKEAERLEAERAEAERARAAGAEKTQAAPPAKSSWLSRLTSGLSRTGQNISSLFVGVKVDETLFEELETALIMADSGVEATEKLLAALRARVRKEKIADAALVKAALRDLLAELLAPIEKVFPIDLAAPS